MALTYCCATLPKHFQKVVDSKVNNELLQDLKRNSSPPCKFRSLQDRIKTLLTHTEEWFVGDLPFKVKAHPCFSDLHIEFIGSTSEGLSLSEISESGINEECDLTAILQTITASQFNQQQTVTASQSNQQQTVTASQSNQQHKGKTCLQLEYSQANPGFVMLKMHINDNSHEWCGLCNIVSSYNGSINEFYLSPVAFTDEFFLMLGFRCSIENMTNITFCKDVDRLFEKEQGYQPESKPTKEHLGFFVLTEEGPAVKTTFLTEENCCIQYDCSLAICCQDWPIIANEFKERRRSSGFPSHEFVNQLTSGGCLIVPKYPQESRTRLEWRLSFCLVERELMLSLSDNQKQCYLLFKAIWRQFLCPPIGKGLQSYHLKNVFLWECENVHKNKWTDQDMVERVTSLLQRLQYNLFTGYCPHYIIPANNLFKDIDQSVLFYAGLRVQTAIFKSDVVWIENDELLILQPHKTRTALGTNLRNTCITALKTVIETMVSRTLKSEYKEMDITENSSLTNDAFTLLELELENSFTKDLAKIISEYIRSSSLYSCSNITRDYICSRANPKQLLVASKDGLLDGIAVIANTALNWGIMIETISSLEILQTENLKQYGFSDDFKQMEELKLFCRMALDDFGRYRSDEERSSIEDCDEDDSVSEHFVCDGCEVEITGVRYHCNSCEDFDLCDECILQIKHPHDFDIVQKEESLIEEMFDEQCKQS